MKTYFTGFIFLLLAHTAPAQDTLRLTAGELFRISEKASFSDFRKLTVQMNYKAVDSSVMQDGTLRYIAQEKRKHGDVLSCSYGKDKRLQFMLFRTKDRESWEQMHADFIRMGFEPGKVHRNEYPEIIEAEDLLKGTKAVMFLIMEQEGDRWYEIDFPKF